jgi:glycosyltransferase involved in cell wall biosynthesis
MKVLYIWFYARSFPDYPKVAAILRARGHEAWVANYDEAGDIAWYRGDERVATVAGPRRAPGGLGRMPVLGGLWGRLAFLAFMLRLRRFFIDQRADVIHVCPNAARMVWLLPLARPRRMRFIIDYRQIAQREGGGVVARLKAAFAHGVRSFYCRVLFDRATFLHALGAAKVLGPDWRRWGDVVPLAVDDPFLDFAYPARLTGGPVTFLYLGSIARVRKLEQIMAAVERLVAQQVPSAAFRLDFIGPDTTGGHYHTLARQMGLGEFVRLLPPIAYDRVPETVTSYDVALTIVPESPPDWQYQPTIKGVEYRALGMPVIATDLPPNRELVSHEVNGLLVQNTAESIAAGLRRFIDDPAFLARCQANAQAMRDGPTWDAAATQYMAIYQRLVAPDEPGETGRAESAVDLSIDSAR